MEISTLYSFFKESSGVGTDTRILKEGQMFIALKGDNFDGNAYALQALAAGARYAVVNAGTEAAESGCEGILVVEDTMKALAELGRYHREHVLGEGRHLPVIALTGTNGKTTTKELIYSVLSSKYKVCATQGNLNNDIGVPLSLLKITADTELAVIEMGANHPNDIEKLVQVCEPDYGLITNVGKAHLLGFGSLEGVGRAKGKLYDYLIQHDGKIFYNADDALLKDMLIERKASQAVETIPYGTRYWKSEILPADTKCPYLRLTLPVAPLSHRNTDEELLVETQLVGSYNANNVAAAIAVGLYFGVSLSEALMAIARFVPSNNRSQLSHTEHNTLIIDAYNANPTSMKAALDNFEQMEDENKIILMGNMGELGHDSLKEHRNLLARLKSMEAKKIALVGAEFQKALDEDGGADNIRYFATSSDLAVYLGEEPLESCLILVKGSRSTAMEKVIPLL